MFLDVSHGSTQRGGFPALPNFGVLSIYTYNLFHRTTKFDVVTHLGRGVYIGISVLASHPKRAEFQRSPILGVLLYLCLHPFTQNDQTKFGMVTHVGKGVF